MDNESSSSTPGRQFLSLIIIISKQDRPVTSHGNAKIRRLSKMRLRWCGARIYPDGNVPPKLTGTQLYGRFKKKEWDRDPELGETKRPSKSTVLAKALGKRHINKRN